MTTGVLLIGFGGPRSSVDVRPFLESVLRGRPVPPGRIDEVAEQYNKVGDRSPYVDCVRDLAAALQAELTSRRCPLPLYTGMRHLTPTLNDALAQAKADGVTSLIGVVLAAYRSIPSFHYYLASTASAYREVIQRGVRMTYAEPYWNDPLFVDSVTARVEEALAGLRPEERAASRWFFTAHSIPTPWNDASCYSGQLTTVAEAVANRLGQKNWRLVYQSRSGRPQDPWLAPDVSEALAEEKGDGRTALVIPIGFLMDHVEVLFDLDIKARNAAAASGWNYVRAKTVGTHPHFVSALARAIERRHRETASPALSVEKPRMPRRVAVIGGGVAGLSAAYFLDQKAREKNQPIDLKIFEAGSSWGGTIQTTRAEGCLMESGPDSFITDKPAALALVQSLGLGDQLMGTNKKHQTSFVWSRGRLVPTPAGFYLLTPTRWAPFALSPLLSWKGKARALAEWIVPRGGDLTDESLGSFVRRRFGSELLDRLAQPMVAGIYGADPEKLSLRATFPRFLQLERDHGSVLRGMARRRATTKTKAETAARGPRYGLFVTLRDGLDTLVTALVRHLPALALNLNSEIVSLTSADGLWRLRGADGVVHDVDAVVLAVSAPRAAALIQTTDAVLATELSGIAHGSVATVNVVFDRAAVRHPLTGFGFVVPAQENRSLTGCTFSDVKFPGRAPAGLALFRAFVGGEMADASPETIAASAVKDLREMLGIDRAPRTLRVSRYPGAMPHYHVGHLDRVKRIRERVASRRGLILVGNATEGIGLPDVIALSEREISQWFDAEAGASSRSPAPSAPGFR